MIKLPAGAVLPGMDTEQKLTAQWLDARQNFDIAARDSFLLQQAIDFISHINDPVIVDLGSGTGNNTLSLLSHCPANSNLVLVEQHADLLAISRNRISKQITQGCLGSLSYIHRDLHRWLQEQDNVDLLCTNALLDLLTAAELKSLADAANRLGAAIYSTLNYADVTFLPSSRDDHFFMDLFERHMCRSLNRGIPLGPNTKTALTRLLGDSASSHLYYADSHWVINSTERDFLRQNLAFYRDGIEAQIANGIDKERLDAWLDNKLNLIEQSKLTLRVKHWDYLILPNGTKIS